MERIVFGTQLIASERARQVRQPHTWRGGEGFTYAHDDAHTGGELTRAAQCYAEAARRQVLGGDREEVAGAVLYWPWEPYSFKVDDDPVRNLVKAGALIAAEIDRLQRAAAKQGAS